MEIGNRTIKERMIENITQIFCKEHLDGAIQLTWIPEFTEEYLSLPTNKLKTRKHQSITLLQVSY